MTSRRLRRGDSGDPPGPTGSDPQQPTGGDPADDPQEAAYTELFRSTQRLVRADGWEVPTEARDYPGGIRRRYSIVGESHRVAYALTSRDVTWAALEDEVAQDVVMVEQNGWKVVWIFGGHVPDDVVARLEALNVNHHLWPSTPIHLP